MDKENNNEIMIINEEDIKDYIYEIRGEKVMLSHDLARIYGYTTKAFMQQVKRSIDKFDGFIYKLTSYEVNSCLRSQNVTSNSRLYINGRGGNRYHPYAFTEQGIYMLMTVLKGELAVKQSRKLIMYFKNMKDYLYENKLLLQNTNEYLESRFATQDRKIEAIEGNLEEIMKYFVDPDKYKEILIMNGELLEADIAYQSIYKQANKSIYIIDDYIDIKTLRLLQSSKAGVEIIVFTENKAKNSLNKTFINDSKLNIKFIRNNNIYHDRFIIIDYNEDNEIIYKSGASSKDAGNKISTIETINRRYLYHPLIDELLSNQTNIIEFPD